MKLLVGLGNPGKKYINTRHNIGYRVVKFFEEEYNVTFSTALNSLVELAKINVYNEDVIIIRPLTFMNASGDAVREIVRFRKIDLDDLLIIYDDVDLNVGTIKVKPSGGSAGHKGMKSIIQTLGTESFKRIKIGIRHPGKDKSVSDYVLSSPKNEKEIDCLKESIEKAKEAIEVWIKYDIETTMSRFN